MSLHYDSFFFFPSPARGFLFYCNYADGSLQTHGLEKQYINRAKLEQKLFNCPAAPGMNMQQPITRWPDVAVVAEFAVWPNCNHGKYPPPRHLWTDTHCSSTFGGCHTNTMTSSINIKDYDIFFRLTTQLYNMSCWVAIRTAVWTRMCMDVIPNFWKWFIVRTLFTFLNYTIIKFLCSTER